LFGRRKMKGKGNETWKIELLAFGLDDLFGCPQNVAVKENRP